MTLVFKIVILKIKLTGFKDKMDIMSWYSLENMPSIITLGRLKTTNVHPDRILPFWVLGVVIKGQRTIVVGDYSEKLTSGDFFLLPANKRHCGIKTDDHDVLFFHFDMKGEESAPNISGISPDKALLPLFGNTPKERAFFQNIIGLHTQYVNKFTSAAYLNTQFFALLQQLSISCQISYAYPNYEHDTALKLFNYINDHFTENICADDLEKEFFLSYRHLNLLFKLRYGCSIYHMVLNQRIEFAHIQLVNGKSIEESALESGFQDYFYFIKAFKKRWGITPGELRKKYFSSKKQL